MLPVAEDPEPLELLGHHADEALGVGAAGAAEVRDAHLALLRPELAIDLELDRQPVAVVARDVGRVEARHRPRLHDEVLEDLVERGAEVDLAVGVRRAVVQDELGRALPLRANLPVQVHGLPAGERLRLGGRQVRLHREPRAGQVERVLPVGHAISCQLYAKKGRSPEGGRPADHPRVRASVTVMMTWKLPSVVAEAVVIDTQEEDTGGRGDDDGRWSPIGERPRRWADLADQRARGAALQRRVGRMPARSWRRSRWRCRSTSSLSCTSPVVVEGETSGPSGR